MEVISFITFSLGLILASKARVSLRVDHLKVLHSGRLVHFSKILDQLGRIARDKHSGQGILKGEVSPYH
jgi:hypothetical protein